MGNISVELVRAFAEGFGVVGILGIVILMQAGVIWWQVKAQYRYLSVNNRVLQRLCDLLSEEHAIEEEDRKP